MADDLYKQGVALVWPYARLVGRTATNPNAEGVANIHEGIAKLRAVLSEAPEHWPTHWILGKAYESLGQPEDEYRCFRRVFELQAENPDVCRELMRVCLALGKGSEAVEAAERACRIRPDDPGLMANLGLAKLVAGDVEGALVVTRNALALAPEDPITRSLLQGIEDIKDGKAKRPERWTDDSEFSP